MLRLVFVLLFLRATASNENTLFSSLCFCLRAGYSKQIQVLEKLSQKLSSKHFVILEYRQRASAYTYYSANYLSNYGVLPKTTG